MRPAASAAGTAAFRRGIFYIGALRRGGVLPSPLRGAADADRRRGVGHSRDGAAGAASLTADTAAAAALRSWLGRRQLEGGCLLTPLVRTGEELPTRLVEIAAARADWLRRKEGTAWAVVECTETAAALLPLYFRQGFGLRALRPLESLAPCFLLRTGCVPARTAPVWVPLEDRVQLALLLAKGYAALDSRPYGGSLALALYPLKETE